MRVLVIRFSSLGDCILLCPLLSSLKASGAEEVAVVTKRQYLEVFTATPGVDRVVALEGGAGPGGLRQVVGACRGREYVVVDAHNTLRSRLLTTALGGADVRIRKYYRQRTGLIIFKRRSPIPSMASRYGDLAEELGYPRPDSIVGGIDTPPSARRRLDELLGQNGRDLIAVAAGSRWPMKQWGVGRYVELVRRIVAGGRAHVILVGDASDTDATARIRETVGDHVTDLAGRLGIMETAAAIERCRALVGNDSGLMHLAEAVGVPVVGLFGPTVEEFGYFPSLAMSKVVERALPCRPCSRNGSRPCPKGTQECMTEISVDAVDEALEDLLEGRGPHRYVLQ